MIVCDAHVTLLAVTGTLQRTPETLVTTPGQYFHLMVSVRKAREHITEKGNELLGYLEYLQQLHPELVDAISAIADTPDPSLIQIVDTSPFVARAAEIACAIPAPVDAAFIFATAEHLSASVLHSRYHGENDWYRDVGERLRIPVDCVERRIASSMQRDHPTSDRRRPVALDSALDLR